MTAEPWRQQAACLGTEPLLFTDPRPETDDTRRAVAICQSCPVQAPCLREALARPANADIGIWGATTETTRRTMRRQTGMPKPPPTPASASRGLFQTLEGDLTDLTGRGLVIQLPTTRSFLLLIDHKPQLRTDDLDEAWRHLTATVDELQPAALAPFTLTASGEITDPSRRALITRLPVAPHLLIVLDGHPHARVEQLNQAQHRALAALARDRPDPWLDRVPPPHRPAGPADANTMSEPDERPAIAACRPSISRQ